ncbi:MAG: hypothetical protein AAGC53_17900 [Actinomycetota bacterium]
MQVVSWLRQSGAHGAWIGVWSLAGFGGTIASPALLATPVVLMFLAPRAMFLAVAAPNLPLLPFLALGLFRLTVADASYFVLGSRVQGKVEAFGVRCRSKRWWSPAGFADRCARWICHSRVMAGVVLFFRPSGRYIGIASAYGVPAWIAAWTSVTGTVLYLLAMHHGAQWLVG